MTAVLTRSVPAVLSALGTAALLAACSSGGSAPVATPTSASARPAGSSAQTAPSTPSADPTANGAASAGVDPANPPAPIVGTTVPMGVEKDPGQTARIDVVGLRRQGKAVVLTVSLRLTTTQTGAASLYDLLANKDWAPALVDTANLKLHRPVSWQGGPLRSSPVDVAGVSGATVYLWAVFAAPPPDVTTLDVHVFDGVPPFSAVPVS